MEARDGVRELVDALGRQRAGGEQAVELLRAVEAAHPHRVLDRRPIPANARRVRRAGDRDDVEVEFGREPAIQAHLLGARVPALRERGEVEKGEVERLLDLVREVAGQHDPRDVRLDDGDVGDGVRKLRRIAQAQRERGRSGGGRGHRGPASCQPVCFGA